VSIEDAALARLRAGLDEDEATARNATRDESTHWEADHGHVFDTMDASWHEDEMIVTAADISDRLAYQRAEHIARQGPHATLLRVEAIRKLIADYDAARAARDLLGDDEVGRIAAVRTEALKSALVALAGIYTEPTEEKS
jgi:uncharacterized protein (DUF1330 family)